MLDDLSKTLMNVVYAGVGAVSLVAEQAGKAGKVLVERGEAAVEQMGKYSEELQRKCQEDAQRRRDERMDGRLSAMSAQEREELRRRLDQLDELDRQARRMRRGGCPQRRDHGDPWRSSGAFGQRRRINPSERR